MTARCAYRFALVGSFASSVVMTLARAAVADGRVRRRAPALVACQAGAAAMLERGGSRRLRTLDDLDWAAYGALVTFLLLFVFEDGGAPRSTVPALVEIGRVQCCAIATLIAWRVFRCHYE